MNDGADTNATIAGLLRDLAMVQSSKQSEWGYRSAASAVLNLEEPVESFAEAGGTLRKISGIGPKSERVVLEVLRTGGSELVEHAVKGSGHGADVAAARALRENFMSRARVVAELSSPSHGAVALNDYRGDLQMHSTWSDGSQTLGDIVEAGLERGYAFCGVTDHSYGLKIARGVSMADLAKQHDEIDRLNGRYAGRFRLFKGIEANIRADGSVDMTAEELGRLDFVLVAPHSGLRSAANQTARMIAAVNSPHVSILGHPRGRLYGKRPGVSANWAEVFAAAEQAQVAIEIDGDPWRQDVDFALAKVALDAGCLLALDSDAHSPPELRNAETAIAHARVAGIPAERVINCWDGDRLLEWCRRRA
jgi:histidinol phosphatase-like PHP family hydrolase